MIPSLSACRPVQENRLPDTPARSLVIGEIRNCPIGVIKFLDFFVFTPTFPLFDIFFHAPHLARGAIVFQKIPRWFIDNLFDRKALNGLFLELLAPLPFHKETTIRRNIFREYFYTDTPISRSRNISRVISDAWRCNEIAIKFEFLYF